jgi:hypothetical protein
MKTKHGLLVISSEDLMDEPPPGYTRPEWARESPKRAQIATFDNKSKEEDDYKERNTVV